MNVKFIKSLNIIAANNHMAQKMIKFIKSFLYTFSIYILSGSLLYAQTAALLPNALQQYFDNNGNPLSSGTVGFYYPSTLNLKTIWRDSAEVTPWSNPITLDAGGKPPGGTGGIYGQGTYRQIVKDRNGNLIWDAVTASTGSGGSGASTGDGDLVGTIKPWGGIQAPNQYAFAYGQEISRSTYSALFTAITQSLNVICTNGSNTLTGISDTTQIAIGSPVEVICVTPGTTVSSKTSSTVVLSNPSSLTINATAVFFPFGNGNATTTFNLPDLRGYVVAGRDNMGGTVASRLTTTYFGAKSPDAQGATGGAQSNTATVSVPSQNVTINQVNLPSVSLSVGSITGVSTGITGSISTVTGIQNTGSSGDGNLYVGRASGSSGASQTLTWTQTGAGTVNFGGSIPLGGSNSPLVISGSSPTSAAFGVIQPTMTLNYIIKITPDTNSAIATGVTDIQGMVGSIACGNGLLCTGNIISVNGALPLPGVIGNIAYYSAPLTVSGNTNANISNGSLTLGLANTTIGKLILEGNTSGAVTLTPQSIAGTPTITYGTSSGTPAVTSSAPLSIDTTTGNISINGAVGQVLAGATPAFTATPVLGASGTLGSLGFGNAASGIVTLQPVAGALGTVTVNIPSAAGTMAVSASAPLALNATTGALTCTGCLTNTPAALTKTDDTNVTLTLGGSPTVALLAATSLTLGWAGQLGLTRGGTNNSLTASNGGIVWSDASKLNILSGTATANLPLLSGFSTTPAWASVAYLTSTATSGGVAYFSSTTQMASSALLAANQLMLGGGAGTAPVTLGSLGTTTTVLHGNVAGAPSFGSVVSADLNITTSTCTNQFLTAISATGIGTCTTATLASAQFANQGTTTTVLHGNGAGNPSFAQVSLTADITGTLPIGNGGTAQTTALAARASSGLNIENAVSIGDTNGTIAATTRTSYHTALSAARTDTLPAANALNAGQQLIIADYAGVATASNTVTISRAGSDTINGGTTFVAVNSAYGITYCTSDGTSKWDCSQVAGGGGGGGVTSVTIAAGAGITVSGTCTITTSGTCTVNGITLIPQGRLTLTSGTPVMTASATNQTTLYYDCYNGGNTVTYYTGSVDVSDTISSCEVSDAMVSAASAGQVVSNNVYDVWWVHSGTNRICLAMSASSGGGGGWSSDTGGSNTARGTGYSQLDTTSRPYITNKNVITNCFNGATNYGSVSANQATYLGTIYATANGQTSITFGATAINGSAGVVGVYNAYNRVPFSTVVADSTSNTTYTSTGSLNSSTTNRVSYVTGDQNQYIKARIYAETIGAAASNCSVGIGLNSTSTVSSFGSGGFTTGISAVSAEIAQQTLGFNYYQALQLYSGTGNCVVYMNLGGAQSGLVFEMLY